MYLHQIAGFELLQEDLSALLSKDSKDARQVSSGSKVYPTKRQNQSIPGRNVLIFVYVIAIISFLTWRYGFFHYEHFPTTNRGKRMGNLNFDAQSEKLSFNTILLALKSDQCRRPKLSYFSE